jgi:hypothetical protein
MVLVFEGLRTPLSKIFRILKRRGTKSMSTIFDLLPSSTPQVVAP